MVLPASIAKKELSTPPSGGPGSGILRRRSGFTGAPLRREREVIASAMPTKEKP